MCRTRTLSRSRRSGAEPEADKLSGMAGGSDIPEGTVTVLFTDLVESTSLNQLLGDEEARVIGRETERLALERIEAHRGVVVKELGDGLMAVFSSARRAVACAREIQLDMARRNRREPD